MSVTAEERERLEEWARRPKTAQALAQRSRIVLACASGRANTVVAEQLRITKQTVGKWRQSSFAGGVRIVPYHLWAYVAKDFPPN